MTPDFQILLDTLSELRVSANIPFWQRGDFWIGLIVSAAGVGFSVLAFLEARRAKTAATEAGRTVKIQTITIELTEVAQRFDRLSMDVRFSEARDLLNEASRRIRRVVSPFQNDGALQETIVSLKGALDEAKKSLNDVRPATPSDESQTPHAVYYAIEADFATINGYLADLLGLFEKKTIDFGEDDEP